MKPKRNLLNRSRELKGNVVFHGLVLPQTIIIRAVTAEFEQIRYWLYGRPPRHSHRFDIARATLQLVQYSWKRYLLSFRWPWMPVYVGLARTICFSGDGHILLSRLLKWIRFCIGLMPLFTGGGTVPTQRMSSYGLVLSACLCSAVWVRIMVEIRADDSTFAAALTESIIAQRRGLHHLRSRQCFR